MCGIAAIIAPKSMTSQTMEASLLQMLGNIRHRGDTFHFAERAVLGSAALGANRLAIVAAESAQQPVFDPSTGYYLIMNGEIYNYRELREDLRALGHTFRTGGDTEVVLKAYIEWGANAVERLDGIFAFVAYNDVTGQVFAVRDHVGIKPLYYVVEGDVVMFGSERKCFLGICGGVRDFPPGSYFADGELFSYVKFSAATEPVRLDEGAAIARCRALLDAAVRKQVATHLPIAVVFSGGLDSTVILHLATKHHKDVSAFSIGTESSPDLEFARRYCTELGVPHVVLPFSKEQAVRTIPDAIFDGELFEPIDISDMVNMSAVYSAIRANGFKIALSGDGSDEIFAGYDLFKQVDNPAELTTYRLNNLYRTDLQRTDRSSMKHSVECRVPFLDRELLSFAMELPFDLKVRNGIEKYILREAFRSEIPGYMIDRPKIRMPEGIGIDDHVFNAVGEGNAYVGGPDLLIDSPQAASSIAQYVRFGYDAPAKRNKLQEWDYFPGGYFPFHQPV